MFDGTLKKVEDVQLGDRVMGIDSLPRTVLELHQGIGELYLVSQNKGIDYVVEEDHILCLKRSIEDVHILKKNIKDEIYTKKIDDLLITAKDFYSKSNKFKRNFFGYRAPIECTNLYTTSIKVSPYGVGEYYGFSLDGDGLFLLKDFTVVHNSMSIAQVLLLERFLTHKDKKFLVLRKTLPSLRVSVYQDWKKFMNTYNLHNIIEENKQNLDYYFRPNNNYLHFGGLDEEAKIRSTDWNYIWLNEATDFDFDDFIQLLLRLSTPTNDGKRNQLFMCLNPVDEFHWIKTNVLDNKENYDLEEIYSTYKDNQFLSEDYKKWIESLQNIDINKYRVYTLGEWGKIENIIYTNWDKVDNQVTDGEVLYGLDFGFANEAALVKVIVLNDKELYIEELLYQTGLNNKQLIEKCNELGISKAFPLVCDSAEPDRISEFRDAGYDAIKANKDLINGIDFVKRFKLHIYKDSVNLLKEIRGYTRRKDKNGRVYEEPADNVKNHALDAFRYPVYTLLRFRYGDLKLRFLG